MATDTPLAVAPTEDIKKEVLSSITDERTSFYKIGLLSSGSTRSATTKASEAKALRLGSLLGFAKE